MSVKSIMVFGLLLFPFLIVGAQEIHNDLQGIWRARVVEVVHQEIKDIPGTDVKALYQTLRVEILEGEKKGELIEIENDYLELEEGDIFFMNYLITIQGQELYSVHDVDRRPPLFAFVALFIGVIIFFGGWQGVRSLLTLLLSFAVIVYLLLPALLAGYSPVLMSILVASGLLFIAIYFTHGFNKESTSAFIGTVIAVAFTGLLAFCAVKLCQLSGFVSDESVYLNFDTGGTLNIQGLLLGAIIIGVLGVLDDIAITQATVVREIYGSAPHLSKKEIYKKAIRVGKEHVGALVNTLALAYAGASLPLLLLFFVGDKNLLFLLNQEVFATEIVRTIVGSIGLILTVPITTYLSVLLLKDSRGVVSRDSLHAHTH